MYNYEVDDCSPIANSMADFIDVPFLRCNVYAGQRLIES
jgi:hypothetical protein